VNKQEQEFINSIQNKINKYGINTTLKECLAKAKNSFFITTYNSKKTELVDVGIEFFLCKMSPAYFIENYCFITIPGKGKEPASLYYFQKEILKNLLKYKKVIYQKSRQTGLSTINSLYCLWKAIFFPKEWILIISKDSKSSQEFLGKIKDNLETLPPFVEVKIDVNNVKSLKFSNGSIVDAFARSKTAGRGTSPSCVVLDEAAFFSTDTIIQGIVASVQASLAKTGGQLLAISTSNGCIPGSEGYWYYTQVKQLEEVGGISEDKTSALFSIDWWTVPDDPDIFPHKGYNDKLADFEKRDYFNNREVYLEARKFFSPIETNWKQNDWLRFQYQTLGDVLYRQEILRDFVIMGNSVFSNEIMEKVKLKIKEPITKNFINGRPLKDFWVWKEPEPKKRYIVASDPSSGTSADFSAIQVLDIENYEQVAEYVGKCTVQDLACHLKNIGRYYNNAYLVVESNSIGEAVFSNLWYSDDPYTNLFKQEKSRNGVTRFTGWITDVKSRQLITNNLVDFFYVDELFETLKIYSERVVGQMSTWINTDRGFDHIKGGHDDAVMALALALYNRSKAVTTGASFIIDEKGRTVSYESSSNKPIEENKGFDYVTSEQRDKFDKIEEELYAKTGLDTEQYKWLLG